MMYQTSVIRKSFLPILEHDGKIRRYVRVDQIAIIADVPGPLADRPCTKIVMCSGGGEFKTHESVEQVFAKIEDAMR
jgi:hypothetical protein